MECVFPDLRAQSVTLAAEELRTPAALKPGGLNTTSARLTEPYFHVEGTRELAQRLRSRTLAVQAANVARANQVQFEVAAHGVTSAQDLRKVKSATVALDRANLQLLAEWKARTQALQQRRASMSPTAVSEESEQLDQMRNLVGRLLGTAVVLDHSHFDNLRMVPAETLRQISTNFSLLVAVAWAGGPGEPTQFLGTGFVYQNHVVTCAHLFTSKWTPPHKDFSKVVLHPYRARLDGFDRATVIPVNPAGCDVFPELDSACLEPAPGPEASAMLDAAHAAQISTAPDSSTVSAGPVYALSVMQDGARLRAEWMPPGRIVFPPEVRLLPRQPANAQFTCATVPLQNLNPSQVDDRFTRTLRAELFSRLLGLLGEDEFCEAMQTIGENYSLRRFADIFQLTCPVRPASNLSLFSEDPVFHTSASPRLPCLGTDLPSQPGASGSPVFLLAEDAQPMLVGFNLGPKGEQSSFPTATSLADYTRVMPIYLAAQAINAFIRKQANHP